MTETQIHPTAIIESGAVIGKGVVIEPYAIIKQHVVLKDGVTIKSHAYIDGHTTIGEGTIIWPMASIGTRTQDLKYRGEITYVEIGKNCNIREFVTINSSCQEGSVVRVGDNCLIMAYCHVAHNCEVGNHVIMSNNATLAGHVLVEDHAIIGGFTPVHQFSRIGAYAMVGGFTPTTHDVMPYTLVAGSPARPGGLNLIGLKRHGFPLESRKELTQAFKLLFRSRLTLEQSLERIEQECAPTPEIQHWLQFCRSSKRGILGIQGVARETADTKVLEEVV